MDPGAIDEAELVMPPGYDSKIVSARALVASALAEGGQGVAAMPPPPDEGRGILSALTA